MILKSSSWVQARGLMAQPWCETQYLQALVFLWPRGGTCNSQFPSIFFTHTGAKPTEFHSHRLFTCMHLPLFCFVSHFCYRLRFCTCTMLLTVETTPHWSDSKGRAWYILYVCVRQTGVAQNPHFSGVLHDGHGVWPTDCSWILTHIWLHLQALSAKV